MVGLISPAHTQTAEIACSSPSLSILCGMLVDTNLVDVLNQNNGSNGRQFTVFAPNNDAFNNLPSDITSAVEKNDSMLIDVLEYHVAENVYYFNEFSCRDQTGIQTTMLNGDTTKTRCINNNNNILQIGDGNSQNTLPEIIEFDIPACNGVVNIIDEVLLPGNSHHNGNGNDNVVGSNYCTNSFDYKCYPEHGRPACCFDKYQNCPTQKPLGECDNNHNSNNGNNNHSYEGPDYCTFSLKYNCYEFGRPSCCFDKYQNCPTQQPSCDLENQNPYDDHNYCIAKIDFGCYERGRPECCFDKHSKCSTNSNQMPACNHQQNQFEQNHDYCVDLNYGCYEFGVPTCCFLNSNLRCSTNRPVCNCGPNRGH